MGIRNLAYCRLTLPTASSRSSTPLLTEWTRVAISRQPAAIEATTKKESFDPATYSQHAYALIMTLLFPETPSHILIERQRFRSMGGSAVQEWTLRVNMFEAMLYAVLTTLAARGLWKGTVHAVLPSKVAGFWVNEKDEDDGPEETPKARNRRNKKTSTAMEEHDETETDSEPSKPPPKKPSKSQKTKSRKIALVSHWLAQTPRIIQLQPHSLAAATAHAYLSKTQSGRSGSGSGTVKKKRKSKLASASSSSSSSSSSPVAKTETTPSIGKLDDLADCLLQGMAWVQWERNRVRILERGASGLEELARDGDGNGDGGKALGKLRQGKHEL